MPGDGCPGDAIIVGGVPIEMGQAGPDGQRGIGDASGDDNVGARAKSFGDRCRAEISVRRDEAVGDR